MPVIHGVRVDFNIPGRPTQRRLRVEKIIPTKVTPGIALCSSISKIYYIIFLKRNATELLTHQLQFAFKENHGTTMSTLILKDIIQYYVDRQSSVYTCFVDATKAFDMVKFDKLFLLMIKRGVSGIDLRAIMDLYSHQRIRTVWLGAYSRLFSATNGIRQGSVASPILFGLYMDELIQRLESNGDGCWLGPHFYGAMGYADDLSLLSPTAKGLQSPTYAESLRNPRRRVWHAV